MTYTSFFLGLGLGLGYCDLEWDLRIRGFGMNWICMRRERDLMQFIFC